MDLAIAHISFLNFRSYEAFDLDGIGPLTVLVGPNAAGKTNVVEGIGLLTAQSSFRHAPVDQGVRAGAPFARLTADVTDGSRQLELAVQMAEGKKKHLLNGKPKRTADLKGLVPVSYTQLDVYKRQPKGRSLRRGKPRKFVLNVLDHAWMAIFSTVFIFFAQLDCGKC